jgi:hypothetical protein
MLSTQILSNLAQFVTRAIRRVGEAGPKAILFALFLLYLCQVWVVFRDVGGATVFHDTKLYLEVAKNSFFSKDVWAGARAPIPIVLFKLCDSSPERIRLAQTILSILSWTALAVAFCRNLSLWTLRIIAVLLTFSLAISPNVLQWNDLLLSESLSISTAAACMAAALMYLNRPRRWAAPLIFLTFIFALSRDANAYVVLLIGVCMGAYVSTRRWRDPLFALRLTLAIGFLGIFATSNVSSYAGKRWQYPLLNVIVYRVLPDQQMTRDFGVLGMPLSPGLRADRPRRHYYYDRTLLPFHQWLDEHGKSVYGRYLLGHPRYLFGEPKERLSEVFGLDQSRYRPVKFPIDPARWDVSLWMAPLWFVRILGICLTGVTALWLTRRSPSLLAILGCALGTLAYPHALLAWHGDSLEVARHGLQASLQLELALILTTVGLAQAVLERARISTDTTSSNVQRML